MDCIRVGWLQLALLLVLALPANTFLPRDASNFLNEYVCDKDVRLVKPRTHSDVEEAVKRHARVKAVGSGHSWNDFLCAPSPECTPEEGDTSAIIVMTTIRPLKIEINEQHMCVWVSAGVTIWDLMEYLGHYHTSSAPRGFALGATPQFVNQTIGGAIATGTHGSSLTYGSLSNQVMGFRVVLANGTTVEIYPNTDPLYFKAFQVNVGRLGVVTDVKMRIIKEKVVRRTFLTGVPGEDLLPTIRDAQEIYKSTGKLQEWLDGTLFGLNPVDFSFVVYNLRETRSGSTPASKESGVSDAHGLDDSGKSSPMDKMNAMLDARMIEDGEDVADGVTWEEPAPLPVNLLFRDSESTDMLVDAAMEKLLNYFGNDTLDAHQAAINLPLFEDPDVRADTYDDYEVSVPIDKMADCIEGVIALLKSQAPNTGLRDIVGFRVVGKETGLLSASNDKPRLWIEFQDYVYYNQRVRQSNVPFKELMAYLVTSPECSPARLHWGKAGWPDPGCWNGAEVYPDTWCDFGCAVLDLDPAGKFVSDFLGVWYWGGAHLHKCCNADGYDKSRDGCDCAVPRQCQPDECPKAPFYSNR